MFTKDSFCGSPLNSIPIYKSDIPFTCSWSSTFGNIYWKRSGNDVYGYYGNKNKTLKGRLTYQNDGSVLLKGTWGRRNNQRSGAIHFVFHKSNKFEGHYSSNGQSHKWKGQSMCSSNSHGPNASEHMAPLNTTQINFQCKWSSSFGNIYWNRVGNSIEGYYGNRNKTLKGRLYYQKDGSILLKGKWGRKDSNRSGEIQFVFHKNDKFEGHYSSHGQWYNWNGQSICRSNNSKTCAPDYLGLLNPSHVRFQCVWSSTFGNIYWSRNGDYVEGYYGIRNKTLKGQLYRQKDGSILLKGKWGRRNNQRSGAIHFVFDEINGFKGQYSSNGSWHQWNGKSQCN